MEIPSLHTEASTTYANSDGKTLSTEFYTDPIRFKLGDAWQPVDTTLVADNGTIKPRATKAGLAISPGGSTDLLTVKSGRDGSAIKISAPQKLAAPKLSGNRAEYANAYGPGIDLAITATPTGFRQEAIIRQRPASPLKLAVPVQLPAGLSFNETSSGKLSLRDSSAKGKRRTTEIPAPLLTDAGANLSVGEEGQVGKVTTAVEKTAAGQTLTYKPDANFLADPDVTYPVTLVVADDIIWTQLPNANDTFINNSSYQNGYANSGAYHLQAGMTNSGTVRWRTYIRFEDIPADSPLRGGRVTNADLVLWNFDSNDCGLPVGSGITARRVTQRWDVSTLTWSNQPTVTSEDANTEKGAYKPTCTRGYMDYEHDLIHSVNGIVQDWADGQPNYGFQLTSGNESESTNWRAYRSKEWGSNSDGSHGPKLIIGYEPATYVVVPRGYEGATPPQTTWEEDKAWIDAGNVYNGELPPAKALTPEEAMAEAKADGRSAKTRFLDAYYPDDLTDQELVDSMTSEEDPPPDEVPPDPNPLPVEDTTPPDVSSTTPSNGQTGISVGSSIKAVFNEPVTGAQIVVKDALGAEVAGNAAMDSAETTLTFIPGAPLTPGTAYTAKISEAKDYAGNPMAAAHSWSFTTGGPDTDAPTVTAIEPGRDATNVPQSTTVKVTFNEVVSEAQITVKDQSDVAVQGTLAGGNGNGNTVWTFTPTSPLAAQTAYRVEVSGAKDPSGNLMAPYTWSFTTTAAAPQPIPGLVAAYGMNEGAGTSVADSSGQNNTGTSSSTTWANGKFGKALSFDGSSSWVTVEDAASLRLTTGMTLSAWVNPTTVADWSSVVTKELDTNGASYSLYAANGSSVPSGWVQTSPADPSTANGISPLPVSTWSHLALTYDGAALRLFVNGQQVAQTALSGSLYDDGSPLRIGGNGVWGEFFSGLIDEVRVYNRAQTATQIQTDMTTPVGSTTPGPIPTPTPTPTPTPPTPVPGLVAAYGMEEGTGTTVADSSGQNNTGAARDTSWAAGKHGKALSFNGSSSWVTVEHAASLRSTTALTLSAWVRPSALGTVWRSVLMKELDEGGAYGLYASNGTGPAGWLQTADDEGGVAGNSLLPLNQWSHLAVTYDGSMARLYVNGTQVAQSAFTGELADDGGALRIGGNGVWGEFFSGLIDEVRVYNRAQTATQIQTDMTTPIGAATAPNGTARTSAAADPAIEKLMVNGSRTVDGVTVVSALTPHLTTWLSAGRDNEAKVEMEVAHKPDKTGKGRQLIWSGQATAKSGDSRVTLQMPQGRLRDGEEMRWRARVTGPGSTGAWTGWQDLTIDTSKAASRTTAATAISDPTPDDIKRVLPSGKATSTPSATYQQCHNATTTGHEPYAITPNRFAHCRYSGWQVNVWRFFLDVIPDKIATIDGHQLTYIQGTLDKREFTVSKHIYIDKTDGDMPSGLRFASKIGSNSQGCVAGTSTGMTGTYTVDQWKQHAGDQWHITEAYTSGPGSGYHLKSDCTINYSVVSKHPDNDKESSTPIYAEGTFRCDKSPQQRGWHNKRGGGCVHMAGVPSFTMTRNDINDKGVKFPNMYDHIKRALTPGSKTYPIPGGKSYPDETRPKNIPGGSWQSTLTRHGYDPIGVGNRSAAGIVCKNELGVDEEEAEAGSCDEFPFASTLQGAARANPPHNFSVARIEIGENTAHGRVLKAWYRNNRILNYDQFWVDIQ
ncbi:LamG-like jellyroll fold domain-containing protein [Nonomuraea sp. NPDC049129]|uniref:LamG-like jellyroll fold domain-containing protein n=1 Tax=Nonomuraea sp. NPDC049129 TaxID=3155272 RepID=UPI0033D1FA2A